MKVSAPIGRGGTTPSKFYDVFRKEKDRRRVEEAKKIGERELDERGGSNERWKKDEDRGRGRSRDRA
uniref:Uncharacterized protein n=1 Tax=Vespula pensylvanica TaxID=30213 RepID=A0A834UGE8_VESPE|nr:hypothetical protein H0235_001042 [Vespula pensylvanica]